MSFLLSSLIQKIRLYNNGWKKQWLETFWVTTWQFKHECCVPNIYIYKILNLKFFFSCDVSSEIFKNSLHLFKTIYKNWLSSTSLHPQWW